MSNWDRVADDQLRAFVERIERLEEERKAIASDIAEVYAEAKGNGFDRKAIKAVVRIRAMDADVRMEHEALVALYLSALGMGSAVDFEADDRASHVHVHMRTREELPEHDAETGEIIDTTVQDGPGPAEVHTLGQASSTLAPATNSTPDSPIGEEAGEAETGETLSASPAINQAETPNDDRSCVSVPGGLANGLQQQATRKGEPARPLPATNSIPVSAAPSLADAGDRGQSVPPPPPAELAPVVTPDRTKPNPWCQDPDDCGVHGSWNFMCGSCLSRKAAVTAAAHQEASEGRTLQ